jgi:hypothetical protein
MMLKKLEFCENRFGLAETGLNPEKNENISKKS